MRLKNKKTGEIGYTAVLQSKAIVVMDENAIQLARYTTLAGLNEEWEDAPEEPKEYWYIGDSGEVWCCSDYYLGTEIEETHREIGNHFETKEEAKKAVKKLKAWKRLEDKGFRFDHIRSIDGVTMKHKDLYQYTIIAYADEDSCDQECLDLLFGV